MSAIETLRTNLGALPPGDLQFAKSLINQADKKGKLTDRQLYWVNKLVEATTPKVEDEVPDFTASIDLGNFSGVMALFDKAKEKLKYPKIRLQLDSGQKIALTVAGAQSQHKGTINVTDGKPYGSNRWFGRIQPNGDWTPASSMDGGLMTSLMVLLEALGKDPMGTALAYGKLTGHCCFCLSELTDERSKTTGYGPTCAKHFGLPWGGK